MFAALRKLLTGWFGPPAATHAHAAENAGISRSTVEIDEIHPPPSPLATVGQGERGEPIPVPYDENLLERARTQWQFGDWESLTKIERDTLQHHPDRAKLALFAAAGRLQTGNNSEARQFIHLAQNWGISKKLISRILIAGVHNSIGRAAIINNQENRAIQHFESSIQVAAPRQAVNLLTKARYQEQTSQVNIPTFANLRLINFGFGCGSTPILLHEGYEACVYRVGDFVVKSYKASYYQYNIDFKRKGEAEFLRKHRSDYFISIVEETPFYIVMPYEGKAIGSLHKLNIDVFDSELLIKWLEGLVIELERLKIKHRDINPSNIIFDENKKNFKLIDFGWAIGREDAELEDLKPQGMNPYGPSDLQAIRNMLDAVKF